jgi:hypothetical protein
MRNISVRIILSVLLVASLASAYVWDCKTEWPDVVSGLNPSKIATAFVKAVKSSHSNFVCGAFVDESNLIHRVAIEKSGSSSTMVEFMESDYGWIFRVYLWVSGEPRIVEYDENAIETERYWPNNAEDKFFGLRRYFSRHIND